jgi:antitoxin MazE
MRAAKLRLDQAVKIKAERGRVVIEPVRAPVFDLEKLVAGITNENKHNEIDFGAPIVG